MKIIVLNGSPKGNSMSITMRFIYYAEKMFSEHQFI